MPRRLRDITYEIPQSNTGIYNPIEYKPKAPDISLLVNRMDKIDAERKEAIQQRTAIDTALGKIELELNPAEFEWFNKEKQKIKDKINIAIQEGNYQGAINTAITEAGRIQSDTEWIGRLKNSAEYRQEMDKLDDLALKGFITTNEAKYYKKKNLYESKIVRDGSGKAIGTDQWKLSETPVRTLDINTLFENAFKSIHPDRKSWDNTSNVLDNNGKSIYKGGTVAQVSPITQTHGGTTQKVSSDEVIAQAREQLYNTPNWDQALQQMWGADFEQYNDDLLKLDTLDKNSQEYKALKTSIDWRTPMFYNGKTPKKEDENTFLNYFDRKLFNSPQAKAYGYTMEDYNNRFVYSEPSDDDKVGKALSKEADINKQQSPQVTIHQSDNTRVAVLHIED